MHAEYSKQDHVEKLLALCLFDDYTILNSSVDLTKLFSSRETKKSIQFSFMKVLWRYGKHKSIQLPVR
jgi:hypothetical protein